MENFNQGKVSAAIVLDLRRANNKNLYPVKYRVTYFREQQYFPTGIFLDKNDWEELPRTRKSNLIAIRKEASDGFVRIKDSIRDIIQMKGDFSFDLLKQYLSRGNKDNVFDWYTNLDKELELEGRVGSQILYNCSLNSLKKFINSETLLFSEVTVAFLKKYERWMLEKKPDCYTTIGIYLRQLRAVINLARNQNVISDALYPFGEGKYEIPIGVGTKKALQLTEIKKIFNEPLPNGSEYEKCRDLWIFSYLCNGMNISDMCKLRFSNIENDEIVFFRTKTIRTNKIKKKISISVLPQTLQIIEKWGNQPQKENFIFPYLSNNLPPKEEKRIIQNLTRQINQYMSKLGETLDIPQISTYTARHSFATVLKRAGANIAYIGEALGHSSLKTTENYLAAFEKDERIKNSQLLTNF